MQLGLLALRLLGWSGGVLKAIGSWLLAAWYRPVILLLLAVITVQALTVERLRGEVSARGAAVQAERRVHAQTIANYRQAATDAARRDIANRARVEAAWRLELEEAVDANEDLRARHRGAVAEFLRRNSAAPAAHSSGGNAAGLSDPAGVPGGTVPDAAAALVPRADLERCADAFAQLEALIRAWQGAASAPLNMGDPAP